MEGKIIMASLNDDKLISWDCLKDQKFLAKNYAQMGTEMVHPTLLQDVITICQEEIRGNHEIFNMINKNGWYSVQMADAQQMQQAAQQVNQMKSGN